MGEHVDNCEIIQHQPVGGTLDYRLRFHRGDANIDDTSDTFAQTEYDAMKSAAAVSQAAFDTAAVTAVGSTWYTGKNSGAKSTWRSMIQAL